MTAPRPAATVVLLRDAPGGPEVLMVRRNRQVAFMADAYVFPGGRLESADLEAAGAPGGIEETARIPEGAFAAGGACQSVQTTPLMTAAQAVEAMRKAGTCGYRSVVSDASAAKAGG